MCMHSKFPVIKFFNNRIPGFAVVILNLLALGLCADQVTNAKLETTC